MKNCTMITQFILVGFQGDQELQFALCFLFLLFYIITLAGNVGMISIITADAQLHSPMYYFLKNLSFLDICYSSVIAPKAMLNFATGSQGISYNGCAVQMFFFSLFGTTECFFLAVMACDQFSVICNPLLYHATMSKKTCALLVAVSYFCSFLNCCTQTGFTFSLPYCESGEVNQFFCDVPAVMHASYANTFVNEIILLAGSSQLFNSIFAISPPYYNPCPT